MQIERLLTIDSTNNELIRRAHAGHYHPVCLVSQEQTAGRGRLGRTWLSTKDALTFSMGLPLAPVDWSGLSLVVGLTIAQKLHPRIQLKWPNDLWVDRQKLAGILIETTSISTAIDHQRYVVIGIGINLFTPPMTPSFKTPAIGLRQLLPNATPEETLSLLIKPLVHTLHHFEQYGFQPYVQGFTQRDALQGLSIQLSNGCSGKYLGINNKGELLLQTEHGIQTIMNHEVSVCF